MQLGKERDDSKTEMEYTEFACTRGGKKTAERTKNPDVAYQNHQRGTGKIDILMTPTRSEKVEELHRVSAYERSDNPG